MGRYQEAIRQANEAKEQADAQRKAEGEARLREEIDKRSIEAAERARNQQIFWKRLEPLLEPLNPRYLLEEIRRDVWEEIGSIEPVVLCPDGNFPAFGPYHIGYRLSYAYDALVTAYRPSGFTPYYMVKPKDKVTSLTVGVLLGTSTAEEDMYWTYELDDDPATRERGNERYAAFVHDDTVQLFPVTPADRFRQISPLSRIHQRQDVSPILAGVCISLEYPMVQEVLAELLMRSCIHRAQKNRLPKQLKEMEDQRIESVSCDSFKKVIPYEARLESLFGHVRPELFQ